jgi:hypothetical protein
MESDLEHILKNRVLIWGCILGSSFETFQSKITKLSRQEVSEYSLSLKVKANQLGTWKKEYCLLGRYACYLLDVLRHFGETSVNLYQITRRNIPDDRMLHTHGHETSNLASSHLQHTNYEVTVAVKILPVLTQRNMWRQHRSSAVPTCAACHRHLSSEAVTISARAHNRASPVYRVSVASRNVKYHGLYTIFICSGECPSLARSEPQYD